MLSSSILQSIVLVGALSVSVTAQECQLCADGADVTYPDRVIPFLSINGEQDPTCRDAAVFAPSSESGSFCRTLQAQANYCGCPETDGQPINACTFCPDGDAPELGDFQTALGDTCDQLNNYIAHLPADHCNENRVQVILRNDFLCKCPNAEAACTFCPDGTSDISNLDRVIPFLQLPHTDDPTCEDLRNFVHLQPDDSDFDCRIPERQAGYCGCANVQPKNVCSFCPNGEAPKNGDLIAPSGDKCSDLNDVFKFLDEDGCNSQTAETMRGLGYFCGCEDVEPHCTLCPNGDAPFDPDLEADEDGTTCGQLNDIVASLQDEVCEDLTERLSHTRYRCCSGDEVVLPKCGKRQNANRCTRKLLAQAPEDECECYNFCNDEFLGCTSFEGETLGPGQCLGVPVTGCNMASAIDNQDIDLTKPDTGMTKVNGSESSATTVLGRGIQSCLVMLMAWTAVQLM